MHEYTSTIMNSFHRLNGNGGRVLNKVKEKMNWGRGLKPISVFTL